jgi:peptide/nickel transport system permease protein
VSHGGSALGVVLSRLPATIELTAAGMLLSVALAVPAGLLSATRRNTWVDHVVSVGALWGQTIPVFWLGIVMIVVFSVQLNWLPTGGQGGLDHLIMPAFTVAAFNMARIARLVRSEMLEVLSQDYIQVARSKGLLEQTVIVRHALRSAAIPVVTIIGLQVGQLLGGAIVTETVFAWPGVGRLMVQAIFFRDFPVVQVAALVVAVFVALITLGVDLSYGWLDPRIRYD